MYAAFLLPFSPLVHTSPAFSMEIPASQVRKIRCRYAYACLRLPNCFAIQEDSRILALRIRTMDRRGPMTERTSDELREKLCKRINRDKVLAIYQSCDLRDALSDDGRLWRLVFDADERVAAHAAWVISHLVDRNRLYLSTDQTGNLIEEVLSTVHETKRRLLLSVLMHANFGAETFRPVFFDHCMKTMTSAEASVAVRVLCMKLAYAQCRFSADLLAELRATVELMSPSSLTPGLRAARRSVLAGISRALSKFS